MREYDGDGGSTLFVMNRFRPNGRTILRRHAAAAVITAAVAVGLLDPYACRQYSLAGASAEAAAPTRTISKSERARLLSAARRALALVPAPRGYALDRKSVRSEADGAAAWSAGRGAWAAPGTARAERIYEPPEGGENAPPVMEQRVYVNSAVEVPSGLASVGGPPRLFPLPGAAAIEVTTIGAEDPEPAPSEGGRVAMPVTPDQAASAITILRIVFADPMTERIYRSAASTGAVDAVDTRAKRPDEIQTLVVELYGGKRDVEALARRLPVAALRRLLDPR